jgi:hypothetical protein
MPYNADPTITADILLILAYAALGALIKIIDEAFDTNAYKKETATLLAIPAAAIMAALIAYNPPSAAIMLALILASSAAGKIDNIAFKILVILTLLITALYPNTTMPWLPFATLTIAAIADEYGNDWSDKRQKTLIPNTRKNTLHDNLQTILQYRPLLLLTALTLTLTHQLPLLNLIAMALFDTAYHTTQHLTHKTNKKTRKNLQTS